MKIPTVKFCCFCIELRTGVLVLGWLGAIFGPIAFAKSVFDLVMFDQNMAEVHEILQKNPSTAELDEILWNNRSYTKAFMVIMTVAYAITAISSIFLLLGVYKERAGFIKQYLAIMIISYLFGLATQIIVVCIAPPETRGVIAVVYLFANCFGVGEFQDFFSIN